MDIDKGGRTGCPAVSCHCCAYCSLSLHGIMLSCALSLAMPTPRLPVIILFDVLPVLQVDRTKTLVNDLKARGVLVHTPDSAEEIPAPGALDVVVVSLPNMNKCVLVADVKTGPHSACPDGVWCHMDMFGN